MNVRTRRGTARVEQGLVGTWADHRVLWIVLLTALLVGGGGRGANLANLFIQMVALIAAGFALPQLREGWRSLAWPLKALVVATLLLPALQLIPLPPAVWSALPGRELVVEAQAVAGAPGSWAPISMTPVITALSLTGLFVPLIVLLLATRLDRQAARTALLALGAAAVVGIGLGTIQLLSDNQVGNLYNSRIQEWLYGTYANHNAAGLFFVIAIAAMIEWIFAVRARGPRLVLASAAIALFLIGTLLTQSRSSVALLVVPLVLLLYHLLGPGSRTGDGRNLGPMTMGQKLLAAVAVLTVLGGAGFALAQGNERLAQTIERFESEENSRPELWADALVTADRYWPVGSGMGTFDEIFQIDESLETLYRLKAGRAHSDYLELAIEGGIFAIFLLFMWFAYLLLRFFRGSAPQGVSMAFVVSVLLCFVAQSAIDYPLRNQAMLCIAALMLGLLAGPRVTNLEGTDVASDS